MSPLRLSCMYTDNYISTDYFVSFPATQDLTMFTISSGSQHKKDFPKKGKLNRESVVFAHHHCTCNGTARHRLRTGPVPRLGTCRSCVFRFGWFLKSSSSLEFLAHVCSRRDAATEPTETLQRRWARSCSDSVTFTDTLAYFRNICPAEYCL